MTVLDYDSRNFYRTGFSLLSNIPGSSEIPHVPCSE